MEIRNVALIVAAATLFNVVPYTEQSDIWTSYVYYPNGTIENLDLTTEPEDSTSTLDELKDDVIFGLYTKLNQSTSQNVSMDDTDTLSASNFNASNPTRIIIHGWQNAMDSQVETSLRDAYLSVGEYNVILVDWSSYASQNYLYARSKIVTVGEYVGQMIDALETIGCDLNDLTVVGHSLGAHIAGVAARSAIGTVANLVGLDPAGPLFYAINSEARLKSTDADFVEVIHTSAGRLGYYYSLGDADYWVNGGIAQRGCGMDATASCSHGRSYLYFAESITQSGNTFTAHFCPTYAMYNTNVCNLLSSSNMGGSTLDVNASGRYYLDTNSEAPFARGNAGPAGMDSFTIIFGVLGEV